MTNNYKQNWMSSAPIFKLTDTLEKQFQNIINQKDPSLLPTQVPCWVFLDWIARQGYLLHGSSVKDLSELRPQTKDYQQADEFSNTYGVYAASDGIWPMMYALRGPKARGQLDMCLQLKTPQGWSEKVYFYSLGRQDFITPVTDLMSSGFIYVLDRTGFLASPPYQHGSLGLIQEAHWVNPKPVQTLMCIPVQPNDFPLSVHLHQADEVKHRSNINPWGFPWLDSSTLA